MERLIADLLAQPPWFRWSAAALVLLFVAGAIGILVRRWREGRAEPYFDAPRRPSEALRAGLALIAGRVEPARDEGLVLRLEVEQRGEELQVFEGRDRRLVTRHKWDESARRTLASAFYLRLDDGSRVRVEPGAKALLLGDAAPAQRPSRDTRVCEAAIAAGEVALVYGALERGFDPEAPAGDGGYRAAPREAWVLRQPSGEPMLVASEPDGALLRSIVHPADGTGVLQWLGLGLGGFLGVTAVANGATAAVALAGAILLAVAVLALRPRRRSAYVPAQLYHRGEGGLGDAEPRWRPKG